MRQFLSIKFTILYMIYHQGTAVSESKIDEFFEQNIDAIMDSLERMSHMRMYKTS